MRGVTANGASQRRRRRRGRGHELVGRRRVGVARDHRRPSASRWPIPALSEKLAVEQKGEFDRQLHVEEPGEAGDAR